MNSLIASTYNPDSERAQRGQAFEHDVMLDLAGAGLNPMYVSDWLKAISPGITQSGLNKQAKMMGDIVVTSPIDGSLVFIECCSMNPPPGKTRFTTSKPANFNGLCRWYAMGYQGAKSITYVKSATWNKYVCKTDMCGAYFVFPTKYIDNLNSAIRSSQLFAGSI
tara:strand:- start:3593 stop:4087 length:495 start_codon:yes stop_codon:yes gene_type:complete